MEDGWFPRSWVREALGLDKPDHAPVYFAVDHGVPGGDMSVRVAAKYIGGKVVMVAARQCGKSERRYSDNVVSLRPPLTGE